MLCHPPINSEGSSDKVYNVELKQLDGVWAVHAFNGRRGKPLKLQNKGEGLDYDEALAIYEKTVESKIKGGYTEHEDGVSFSSSAFAGEKTEFRAQLLNEITKRPGPSRGVFTLRISFLHVSMKG